MGNIFNKGLDRDDKKELFKRLENIKVKNEELLNAFSAANKVRLLKMRVILIMILGPLFSSFTEILKILREFQNF